MLLRTALAVVTCAFVTQAHAALIDFTETTDLRDGPLFNSPPDFTLDVVGTHIWRGSASGEVVDSFTPATDDTDFFSFRLAPGIGIVDFVAKHTSTTVTSQFVRVETNIFKNVYAFNFPSTLVFQHQTEFVGNTESTTGEVVPQADPTAIFEVQNRYAVMQVPTEVAWDWEVQIITNAVQIPSPIPAPATLILFSVGLLGLALVRCKA